MVIWFNHWFSSANRIINLMRRDVKNLYVIGTNKSILSAISLECDKWYQEPEEISGDSYVRYCLNFCIKHNVDIFAPCRESLAISRAAKDFADIGVKLLLDSSAVELFNDKIQTYQYLADVIPKHIPVYYEITSLDDFDNAYTNITASGDRMIIKYAADEGATSFRVIDDSLVGSSALDIPPGKKLSLAAARAVVANSVQEHVIIAMHYLNGIELSCDCLAVDATTSIVLSRFKCGSRIYEVKSDKYLTEVCRKIMNHAGLSMPCNIQFRFHNGRLYLLEVNTRMSGGVQLSCLASGINIPALAVNKLLKQPMLYTPFNDSRKVSYIEVPVCLT